MIIPGPFGLLLALVGLIAIVVEHLCTGNMRVMSNS